MLLLGKDYFEQDPPALPPEESCGLLGDGSEEDAVPCECPEKWYQKILPFLRRNRKGAIVAASVLVIGLGVYLNWYLYRTDVPAVKNEGETTEQSTAGEKDADPVLKEGKLLSNVFNRVVRSCFYTAQKYTDGKLPFGDIDEEVLKESRETIIKYERYMYRFEKCAQFKSI